MAYSYIPYTGNGATTQFAVPFPYIRKEHVFVTVDDVTTSYTWVNASTVQVSPAPASGAEVIVKRVTPISSRLVDYTDGSTLVAADLDTDSLQHLYTEQELTDSIGPASNLRALYYGAYTTDPTVDPFGQALDQGDLYYNTQTKVMRVWNGTQWENASNSVSYVRWKKTAAGGETSLSGADDASQGLTYTPGIEQVYLNGALLTRGVDYTATTGSTITGLAALTAGDVVEVLGLSKISVNSSSGLVDFVQAGTGAVVRTVEGKLRDAVSAKDFGAVGDGYTNDLAKLKVALESGKIIDGGGYSYAVQGTLKPTSFCGLVNATLVQTGNNTTSNFNTLEIEGISNFVIDNVNINMGSNITTLFADDGNNGIKITGTQSGSGAGTTTAYIENFNILNVRVTGNGCGTGIHIRHAKRFSVTNCTVRDRVSGSSPDPANDSQNGFQINNCANFAITGCQAYNLTTRLSGVNTLKWTRGFLFAEIRDCSINNCISTATDQGFDFSGSVIDGTSPSSYEGNRRFVISGCSSNSSGTWGFKFANVTHDGLISGCIASGTTGSGFVSSSQNVGLALSNNNFRTQNLTFTGCKVVNCLTGGWANVTRAGFYVIQDGNGLYPRNVKFVGCSVEDNQAVPTTDYGFVTDVPPINPPSTDYNKDVTIRASGCQVKGAITHYGGIHFPGATLSGDSSGTSQNSTWTAVDLAGAEIYDASGMHSVSSSPENSIIKESGLYFINATATFSDNAFGERKIRIVKNGASIGQEMIFAPHPTSFTRLFTTAVLYLQQGDSIRFEIWQNTGGSLNYNRANAFMSIARLS